jgi:hypothetical protein
VSPPKRHSETGFMLEIFLTLLLICAILALLVLGPSRAPRFEELMEFTCDSSPQLPIVRGSRASPGTYYATCRSDHQVAHLGGLPIATNASQWQNCRRSGGVVKNRRPALPSPYGAYIFEITCNGAVIVSYQDASASYESRRAFVGILAWCLLALSAVALALRIIHTLKRRRRRAIVDG